MGEKTDLLVYEKLSPAAVERFGKLPEEMSDVICRRLIAEALKARKNAYAPYSGFKVGAALLTAQKEIYGGCNIENAAFSPTNCAERTAFFKAVSEGKRDFYAIAIVGGKNEEPDEFCAPCGVCRQVMTEFCDPASFLVVVAKNENDYMVYTLEELMPLSFSGRNLE